MDLVVTHLPRLTRRLPRTGPVYPLMHWMLRHYMGTRSRMVDSTLYGYAVRLDVSEFVDCALLYFPQLYDPDELALLRSRLRPGDVFLDLGAHIGLYTLVASGLVGRSGTVIAVEPEPATFERLVSHLAMNAIENVQALNVGLSDRRETLRLSSDQQGNRAASSFLHQGPEGVAVPCQPLPDLLSSHGVARVRGAKLDIEGFEYRVLARFFQAANRALWPDFLIVEYYPAWTGAAGGDVIELLKTQGYRVQGTQAHNYMLVHERAQ